MISWGGTNESTGYLPEPIDISIFMHYARIIWGRKGKENLADLNDILPIDQVWAQVKKEASLSLHHPRRRKKSSRSVPMCQKLEDERRILSPSEINRLERAQTKLCASQTWYRPHSSPTHYVGFLFLTALCRWRTLPPSFPTPFFLITSCLWNEKTKTKHGFDWVCFNFQGFSDLGRSGDLTL